MREHNPNLPKQRISGVNSSLQTTANNKKIQNYVFNLNEVLGRGNFSQVYKAVNVTSSNPFLTQTKQWLSR